MKPLVLVLAALIPLAASAQQSAPAGTERGYHARLYDRYCEKAREGPEAYVQFVRRMYTVTGLTISDFVPERRGDRVVADCGLSPERSANLQRVLYAKADR